MSPSRKVGVVGMLVGGAFLLGGTVAFTIPFLFARAAFSPSLHFTARHEMLRGSAVSWLIGAPTAFAFGAFGALVLFLSLVVYVDTRRRERTVT